MKNILFFVICEADEDTHKVCIDSIKQLKFNVGYTVSIFEYNNKEMKYPFFMLYNNCIKNKVNEYVILVRDSVSFIYENMLHDIISICHLDNNIGLIGVQGTKILNDSNYSVGGYYLLKTDGEIGSCKGNDICSCYEEVDNISNIMLVIHGDILLYKDINYDIALECIPVYTKLYGYKIVVPQQQIFWCLDCFSERFCPKDTDIEIVQIEKDFCQYLLHVDFPLLSVGIPTFNRSKYLRNCLSNLTDQIGKWPFVEIFISNNASTDETEAVINEYSNYDNLMYYHQKENIGGDANFSFIYDNVHGDYVVACGDDDYYEDGTILRILYAIYRNPQAAVIGLDWFKNEYSYEFGRGIDNFIVTSTGTYTSVSSFVLNKKYYDELDDKRKYGYTHLNQVYVQLSMLQQHPEYVYIYGHNFRANSGKAATPLHMLKWEEQMDFCNIFIVEYYAILAHFLHNGLSEDALKEEKLCNLRKIVSWLKEISIHKGSMQWRIDDNIDEIMEKYYSNEVYYDKIIYFIKQLDRSKY